MGEVDEIDPELFNHLLGEKIDDVLDVQDDVGGDGQGEVEEEVEEGDVEEGDVNIITGKNS